MKLTSTKLRQMIQETLNEAESEDLGGEAKGSQEKEGDKDEASSKGMKPDVKMLYKYLQQYLPNIDNYAEYYQLLTLILKHPVPVGKGKAMRDLKDLYLAGMKEK